MKENNAFFSLTLFKWHSATNPMKNTRMFTSNYKGRSANVWYKSKEINIDLLVLV